MNKSLKLLLMVTVFLLASSIQVECRRTYSSRSSSSGRGNRGKNQPSSGGAFSSWFGGSKSSSSGSGSVSGSKPAPSSAKTNWQTAGSHAAGQSKTSSSWQNPYYKPPGSAPLPSAPKEASYGWKPATGGNAKPASSYPSSNIGSRGYPVQSGVQQGSQTAFGGYKPASGVPGANQQPAQSSFAGYRPASGIPNSHASGYQPSGHQNSHGGYHAPSSYHPAQPSHGYQPSHGAPHQPSYHPSGAHYSGTHFQQPGGYQPSYSSHGSFGGGAPSYQGAKLFGGGSGHYGYPGSGGWGIDTYGAKKSSGTGKLLTGLAVGAAGGYLTSSLVNRITNPWKYSGYGYGSGFGYGSGLGYGSGYGLGHDYIRSRDESAFERGYERGVQARQNENNNKETAAAPVTPDDPTSKWVQCVAFDPQTQQTLINPNCSCTVTTSLDERTGQPISVHHCTTLNGLVMQPVPVQPSFQTNLPPRSINGQPSGSVSGPSFGGATGQPLGGVAAPGPASSYGVAYEGNFEYNGGPTVYIPPQASAKIEPVAVSELPKQNAGDATSDKAMAETRTELSSTAAQPELSTKETKSESTTGTVKEHEETTEDKIPKGESAVGQSRSEAPAAVEGLPGELQESRKRTAEFYGQLQKIVNMGNFVDGG